MSALSLLISPAEFTLRLHPISERSPTDHARRDPVASVSYLAPIHFRRNVARPVSYYAFFQGWLLLSQPPGCLSDVTSLYTQYELGNLSRRSGLFPSRPWTFAPKV